MVIVFDVNGTLLDSRALAPRFRKIFGLRYPAREWFTEVVQYAMATSLSGGAGQGSRRSLIPSQRGRG